MKLVALMLLGVCLFSGVAFAGYGQTKDDYGRWTNNENLFKDTDHDGVMNINDSNDRNPNKWN